MEQCYFCKGPVSFDHVRVIEERSGHLVVFEDVPAEVCGRCGQRYYSGAILKEMDRLADSGEDIQTIPARVFTLVESADFAAQPHEVMAAR